MQLLLLAVLIVVIISVDGKFILKILHNFNIALHAHWFQSSLLLQIAVGVNSNTKKKTVAPSVTPTKAPISKKPTKAPATKKPTKAPV